MPDWGGPRPGAGRKPKQQGMNRVTFSPRVAAQTSQRLRSYAKRAGLPLSEVVDELVCHVEGDETFMARLLALAGEPEAEGELPFSVSAITPSSTSDPTPTKPSEYT